MARSETIPVPEPPPVLTTHRSIETGSHFPKFRNTTEPVHCSGCAGTIVIWNSVGYNSVMMPSTQVADVRVVSDRAETAHCLWCERAFKLRKTGGSAQRFCCLAHRKAFWTAARRWTMRAIETGLITVDCLKAHDASVHFRDTLILEPIDLVGDHGSIRLQAQIEPPPGRIDVAVVVTKFDLDRLPQFAMPKDLGLRGVLVANAVLQGPRARPDIDVRVGLQGAGARPVQELAWSSPTTRGRPPSTCSYPRTRPRTHPPDPPSTPPPAGASSAGRLPDRVGRGRSGFDSRRLRATRCVRCRGRSS